MHNSDIILIFAVSNQNNKHMNAKKEIKILVSNESASYSSETIMYNDNKLKIVSENGNAYSHLRIYAYTKNGDLGQIANEHDVPGYKSVNYICDDKERVSGNKSNIAAAESYIKKIF